MFSKIFKYIWGDNTNTSISNKRDESELEKQDQCENTNTSVEKSEIVKSQKLFNLSNNIYKSIVYELNINWYSNFIGYSNQIISNTYSILDYDEDEILDEYFSLYNKISNQYRLIDYMFRTRKGMFSDNIVTRSKLKCHINSLVIRKGYIYENNSINYETNICESVYNISIIVDNENNWEII